MTARRPLSLMLAALVLACAAPRAARAASPGPPAWWDKAWKYRKTVRVSLPRHGNDIPVTFFEASSLLGERSLTGKAVISVESGTDHLSSEIVVTDAAGSVIPSRSFSRGWERQATILFKAMPISATYYIYYGNKDAKRKRMEWQRSAFPIAVVTVRVSGPADIETPARAAKALLTAKHVLGKTETYSIQYSENPFGLRQKGDCITLHSGLLFARVDGTYEFGVDAGGTAHLLIDGSLALTARGKSRPAKNWRSRAQVRLTRGVHNLTILHGERPSAQGIRVGWIRPGDRGFTVMSGGAFARGNYIDAEVAGLEQHGGAIMPFFTFIRSDVAFRIKKTGKAMVALELKNHTRGDGLAFKWTVGEEAFAGRSPKCFVEADGRKKVVLDVTRAGKKIGSYSRTVSFAAVRRVDAAARLELLRCPNVIYKTEGAKLAFKVMNPSKYPVPVRFQRAVGDEQSFWQDFEIAAGDEQPLDIKLPALPDGERSLDVTFRLWLAGTELGVQKLRIIRPGPGLAALTPKLGHLVDGEGRRVVIVTHLEDEDEHRRWAALKWLAGKLKSKPKKVLLYGDPMLNVRARGVKGYVDIIRERLADDDCAFTFVENRGDAIVPCVADIPAFAAALEKHEPDLVIISPGSRDVSKGTTRLELARSIDVLIDLVRLRANRPGVILVSPPPLVSNPKASAENASAVRIIAGQHRVPFVDLHSRITAKANWQDLYKQDADDEVFYLYPNPRVHNAIAKAILDVIE